MIYNYDTEKTVSTTLADGTQVVTTFNRLVPTGSPDEYTAYYVVDNAGSEQATSNGVLVLSQAQIDQIAG